MYTYYPNQKELIWCGAFGGCCYPLFMIIDNFLNIHNLCVRDTQVMNQQYPLSFTSESECLMWLLQTIRPVAQSLVAHYCSLHISIHTYMHVCMYVRAQMPPHEWTFAELRIHASTVVCMYVHEHAYVNVCITVHDMHTEVVHVLQIVYNSRLYDWHYTCFFMCTCRNDLQLYPVWNIWLYSSGCDQSFGILICLYIIICRVHVFLL